MSTTFAHSTGDQLGRYRLERELGRGGWGIVYLAHDTSLNVDVALKILSPHISEDPNALMRFKREVLLARAVTHPGICRVFDLHEIDGAHFITMEHIEGQSLEKLLEDEGVLSISTSLRIARGVALALTAAHSAGIVHRDLKPSNVIIARNGKPSLLDFGFATSPKLEGLTAPGFTVGSLRYVAPEALRGEGMGPLTDIYSLGVVLYRCVTGRHPHETATVEELLQELDNRQVMPPSRYNTGSFPELDDLIMRAIAPPGERFQSAVDFERALAALETNAMTKVEQGPPTSPWDRDIESLVSSAVHSPSYSSLLQQKVSHTTVLFTDIVGVTSYFDRHGDTRGFRLIETHNKLLMPIVERHGGIVVKTIGDAIMATFPRADSAAFAAVAMQEALESHNTKVGDSENHIHVRIGMNSGRAITQQGDVFGNTVNVAARICNLAQGDEILVSATTRDMLIDSRLATEYHSLAELKGKQGNFALFSLTWESDTQVTVTVRDPPPRPEETTPNAVLLEDAVEVDATQRASASRILMLQSAASLPRRRLWRWGSRRTWALGIGAALATVLFGLWLTRGHEPQTPSQSQSEPVAGPTPVEQPLVALDGTTQPSHTPEAQPIPSPAAPKSPPKVSPAADKPAASPRPTRGSSSRKGASDADRGHPELARLATETAAAVRGQGFIDGDLTALDEAQRELQRAVRAGDAEHARDAATRAVAVAKSQSIDRAFISRKLTRLNGRYDTLSKGSVVPKLDAALGSAAAAFARNDFRAANSALNQAYDLMEGMRR